MSILELCVQIWMLGFQLYEIPHMDWKPPAQFEWIKVKKYVSSLQELQCIDPDHLHAETEWIDYLLIGGVIPILELWVIFHQLTPCIPTGVRALHSII